MSIYDYEAAFGAWDVTTQAMRRAISRWRELYYEKSATEEKDSCQRIGYTVVNKLVRSMFGEYQTACQDPAAAEVIRQMNLVSREAVQQMLVGGECYLKPCIAGDTCSFSVVPRENILIFRKDSYGNPVDVGMVETSVRDRYFYTLLERRRMDEQGALVLENRLFRSLNAQKLGVQVSLREHPAYESMEDTYRYSELMDTIGLVRLRTPMLNCVDGSSDGVAVYAAAAGLIENIDRNEAQMDGEFSRGESRVIMSADLLDKGELRDHLFVGLDEDPERVGMTIFSPQLREKSYLARKQEYLRNVESLIGLRRGMLCDANEDQRTATEIASSAGDYNLTIMEFQKVWEEGLRQGIALCRVLAELYHLPKIRSDGFSVDWGNGILYDEEKTWQDYRQMVKDGILRPEIALGWRFNMPAETPQQLRAIRQRFLPEEEIR